MCYHKLYIYTTCGHSFFAPVPLTTCRHASIAPSSSHSSTCKLRAHPYHSLKLENLCNVCARKRSLLLESIEARQIVRFDEWQWKVSYSTPTSDEAGRFGIVRDLDRALGGKEAEKQVKKKDKSGRLSLKRLKDGLRDKASAS